MSVVSVSREENGQAAVVLSSTRYLAQTTLLRHQAADAVLHTYQGLRVPAHALRVSADGTTGVYCVDGENASFRPIELVYQGEGYTPRSPPRACGTHRPCAPAIRSSPRPASCMTARSSDKHGGTRLQRAHAA